MSTCKHEHLQTNFMFRLVLHCPVSCIVYRIMQYHIPGQEYHWWGAECRLEKRKKIFGVSTVLLTFKNILCAITFQKYLPSCTRWFICRISSSRRLLTARTDGKETQKGHKWILEKKWALQEKIARSRAYSQINRETEVIGFLNTLLFSYYMLMIGLHFACSQSIPFSQWNGL